MLILQSAIALHYQQKHKSCTSFYNLGKAIALKLCSNCLESQAFAIILIFQLSEADCLQSKGQS
ncbi:hypothetical protein H6H03_00390 [Nostoc paludosum FACHB-159]|uniref:Uncharacterized protein n=1 Tax=Nostoc paludosum FACHB-159 TaxID=2692908 RepID=A0ABR8K0D9_9NOSO|nr:hypothetical protein [Nostoc paludosum FACHB-159]